MTRDEGATNLSVLYSHLQNKEHIDNKDNVNGMCCILPLSNFIGVYVCFLHLV